MTPRTQAGQSAGKRLICVPACVQEIIQTSLWGGAFQISVLQWRLDRRPERGVQVTKNCPGGEYLNQNNCFSVSIWFIVGLACVAGFSLLTLVATIILLSRRRTSRRKTPDPAAVFLDQLPPGRRQEEEEPSRSTRSSEEEEVSRAEERRGWTEQRDFPRYPVSRHLYQVKSIPVGKTQKLANFNCDPI